MSYSPETPFDNIESAHQFVDLLLEVIEEAQQEIGLEIHVAAQTEADRRKQALQLVAHNLAKLSTHITKSRRILNDLRTLRRLLLEERKLEATETYSRMAAAG